MFNVGDKVSYKNYPGVKVHGVVTKITLGGSRICVRVYDGSPTLDPRFNDYFLKEEQLTKELEMDLSVLSTDDLKKELERREKEGKEAAQRMLARMSTIKDSILSEIEEYNKIAEQYQKETNSEDYDNNCRLGLVIGGGEGGGSIKAPGTPGWFASMSVC